MATVRTNSNRIAKRPQLYTKSFSGGPGGRLFKKAPLVLLIFLSFNLFSQQVDVLELDLLSGVEVPVRWENIEGGDRLVSGVEMVKRRGDDFHRVFLEPGEEVVVRVEARQVLRLYSNGFRLSAGDVVVSRSNGSGLHVGVEPRVSTDGFSLVVSPAVDFASVVRVSRPGSFRGGISFGLFVSFPWVPGPLVPYDSPVSLPEDTVLLRRADRVWKEEYGFLLPGQWMGIMVKGPSRIRFTTRLKYTADDSRGIRSYRIDCDIAKLGRRSLRFTAIPEREFPVLRGGEVENVARRRHGFMDIPVGTHYLQLRSSAPVYLAVDYMVLGKDGPLARELGLGGAAKTSGKRGSTKIDRNLAGKVFQRLVDLRSRENGLAAVWMLREVAERFPVSTGAAAEANDMWLLHTFFRPLLPVGTECNEPVKAVYDDSRLMELEKTLRSPGERVVLKQFLSDEMRIAASGNFFPLPVDGAADYLIPPRGAPSVLRVAVMHGGIESRGPSDRVKPVRLSVQLEKNPPLALTLYPAPEVPDEHGNMYTLSPVDSLTRMLNGQDGSSLAFLHDLLPRVSAGYVDIPLPPGVERVKVSGPRSYVALSYRASRPFEMDSARLLRVVEEIIRPNPEKRCMELFKTLAAAGSKKPSHVNGAGQAIPPGLSAHYQPLIRLINSRYRQFKEGVENSVPVPSSNKTIRLEPWQVQCARIEAKRFEKRGWWLNALESRHKMLNGDEPDAYREARIARIRALLELGEKFLGVRELKGIILYEKDQKLREAAFSLLEEIYVSTGDSDGLTGLWCAEVHARPSGWSLGALSGVLADAGEFDAAIAAGLLAPPELQPLEQLLSACLHTRRYRYFNYFLQRLPASKRLFWRGLREAAIGNHERAAAMLELTGKQGKTVKEFIKKGLFIKKILQTGTDLQKKGVLTLWEEWQQSHPGPHIWRDRAKLVTRCAGTAQLYAVERDAYSRAFRVNGKKPVKLTVRGPVSLKLEIRPVHSAPPGKETSFLDSWVTVKEAGQVEKTIVRIPITRNRPAPGLRIFGGEAVKEFPGTKEEKILMVPPGEHTLVVSGSGAPLLVRVFAGEPVWHFHLLPRITTHTLAYFSLPDAAGTAAKAEVTTNDPRDVFNIAGDVWLAEQNGPAGKAAAARAVWTYMQMPGRRDFLDASGVIRRLLQKSDWEQVTSVVDSGGLLPVKIKGWQPESQFLRVRRASLPPASDDEIVMTTTDILDLGARYLRGKDITVECRVETPDYIKKEKITLELRLDGEKIETIELEPGPGGDMVQAIRFRLPRGEHVVSLIPLTYRPNHFIFLRAPGFTREVTRYFHVASQGRPVRLDVPGPAMLRIDRWKHESGKTFSHYLYVPFDVSDVYLFADGRISHSPDSKAGSKARGSVVDDRQGYYRVFQLRYLPGKADRFYPLEKSLPPGLPLNPLPLSEPPGKKTVGIHDAVKPGGQEDGTISFKAGFHTRRPFLEEGGATETPDQFVQFTVSKRFFNKRKNLYHKTSGLLRLRTYGNPSLGLSHRVNWRPYRSLFVFDFTGSAYLQQPHGSFIQTEEHPFEWSINGKVQARLRHYIDYKTLHLPGIRLFGRYLSAVAAGRSPVDIDHDVYTPYKRNHRFGMTIEEMLLMMPRPDLKWWVKVGLTTNESFNPFAADYLNFATGFAYWMDIAQLEISGQWRRYFPDDHRAKGRHYYITSMRLSLDIWLRNRTRLEIGGRFDREWDQGENSFSLFFSWHLDRHRGFFDFSPAELDFKDLRERRLFLKKNLDINTLDE